MTQHQPDQGYLNFGAKPRLAALLAAAILAGLFLWGRFGNQKQVDAPTAVAADSLLAKLPERKKQYNRDGDDYGPGYERKTFERKGPVTFTRGERFSFDPNTLNEEGWRRLGLQDRTINTILNYRNKGGRFYKQEDLQRIWALPDGFYDWVKDYIAIERKTNSNESYNNTPHYLHTERRYEAVSINSTDTSALIALPGIGSKLAYRIINFRNKLGGFYSVDQIGETYGLPDSTFQKIKPLLRVDAAAVKKFNINTATKEELKTHPYIRWNLANAIVEYRAQHGAFSSIEDVRKIELVDEATFQKIKHYLSL